MRLDRLRGLDRPIRVGVVGAGAMGVGVCHQVAITPGFECVAVADTLPERAIAAARKCGRPSRVAETNGDVADALSRGEVAVCADGMLAAECEGVDVLLECTSSILPGAEFTIRALEAGKPVVLVNAEIDLAFGPCFASLAERRGTVCTSMDGDQHGVIKRLVDDLQLWGFDLVMAGNIKGFLDRHANPESIIEEADKRDLDYRMCAGYTDGTKLSVEMALIANGLGAVPDKSGMHGPRAAHVREVPELFDLADLWARNGPVVDYVLGAEPDGGVFAVGHCDDEYQRRMMAYYKMGPGPFYVFYRPYHLCHVETLATTAVVFLDKEALLTPAAGPLTDVYCRAKRDLAAGEVLDGVGGFCCYGVIDRAPSDWGSGDLPICLSEGLRLNRGVPKGRPVTMADVDLDFGSRIARLYAVGREAEGA